MSLCGRNTVFLAFSHRVGQRPLVSHRTKVELINGFKVWNSFNVGVAPLERLVLIMGWPGDSREFKAGKGGLVRSLGVQGSIAAKVEKICELMKL